MLMDNLENMNVEQAPEQPIAPVVGAAPAPKKKQGGKIAIIALLCLLVGAAGASAVFVGLNGGLDFSKKTSSNSGGDSGNNTEKPDQPEGPTEETEISDKELESIVAARTNRVMAGRNTDEKSIDVIFDTKLSTYKEATKETKSRIALAWFYYHSIGDIPIDEIPDSVMSKQTKEQALKSGIVTRPGFKVDYAVKSYYKELFGEDMTVFPDEIEDSYILIDLRSCGLTYAASIESYVNTSLGCGGTGIQRPVIYHYKYTERGDETYAYIATGNINMETKKWTSLFEDDDVKIEGVSGSEITKDNYSKFPHYKVSFKKNKYGNYIYQTIEKVED